MGKHRNKPRRQHKKGKGKGKKYKSMYEFTPSNGICSYRDCKVNGPRCSFNQCLTHCREHHQAYHQHPQDNTPGEYTPLPPTLVAETEAA